VHKAISSPSSSTYIGPAAAVPPAVRRRCSIWSTSGLAMDRGRWTRAASTPWPALGFDGLRIDSDAPAEPIRSRKYPARRREV